MVINGVHLLGYKPIKDMNYGKIDWPLASHGLTEAGYDIRIRQDLVFWPAVSDIAYTPPRIMRDQEPISGNFCIASAIEEFDMPRNLVGVVHDKSTWARRGLSVFNTVIEPGWRGFLTLELVYHGSQYLHIPAGTGIAQVLFHQLSSGASYAGKYQAQPDRPVDAIFSGDHA